MRIETNAFFDTDLSAIYFNENLKEIGKDTFLYTSLKKEAAIFDLEEVKWPCSC